MAFPQATAPLRARRSRFGDVVFLLFAIVQIADGWMTYQGIRLYGPGVEANPLIVWYASIFGAAAALTGAKTLAVMCGVILHLLARHVVIAFLTITYVIAAVLPWMQLLWF
jgi:hypothetical protein